MAEYNDQAVFIPGSGTVLLGAVGEAAPDIAAVKTWVEGGMTGTLAKYSPLGYTSVDSLPGFETDTEGGEKKGAWENDSLRTTRVKTTETITVTPIQWTEDALIRRFGQGTVDTKKGTFTVPSIYTPTENSVLVVIVDAGQVMLWHFPKASSAPEGSIEMDPENFLGMPIKYTILQHQGAPKMTISLEALKTTTSTD